MANLTPIGVQAVVEGLSAFTGALGQMDKAMQNTGNKAGSIGSQFVGLGDGVLKVGAVAAGAALAGITALTAGTIAFGASAIQSASDVAEMQSLFNIVFKQDAAAARTELDAFAASVGRNKYELQGFAGSIGALLGPMGMTQTQTTKMSTDFAQLAVDLSSFFNVTESDALLALKSGLVGESEPLRKFGVNLSEAAIQQEALSSGLVKGAANSEKMAAANRGLERAQITYNEAVKKYGGNSTQARKAQIGLESAQARVNSAMEGGKVELDNATKAQAIYNIIMKQTAQAQGDATRTSGGWANQMRALTATIDEAKTDIGMQLLPVVTPLLKEFSALARSVLPQLGSAFTGLVIPAIQKVNEIIATFQTGGLLGGLTAIFGVAGGDIAAFFDNLTSDIGNLANTISSILLPAFNWLSANAMPMLSAAIGFVNENWEAFKGALVAVGAVLAGAAIVAAVAGIGAAIAGLASPIGLIIAAAALLGAAWSTNFLGIRDALTAFWAVAQPIAAEFVAWYGGQMVAGIQQLTAIWNSVLLPAFQVASAFIQSSVIPAIQQVYTWLATNLPAAIQAASGYWNGVLLPALQTVGNWINAYLTPAIMALGNFLGTTLNMAVTAAAGLWQNVLYPALLAVYNFLTAQLTPALTTTSTTISGVLGPVVDVFVNGALAAFQQGLRGIQDALTWVTTELNEMTTGLNNVKLPAWLQPGSPTPFEIGLRGIADVLKGSLTKALTEFGLFAVGPFNALAISINSISEMFNLWVSELLPSVASAASIAASTISSRFSSAEEKISDAGGAAKDLSKSLANVGSTATNIAASFGIFTSSARDIRNELLPALNNLIDKLKELKTLIQSIPPIPGGGSPSSGFQAGVQNFMVPPGFPNDTYPIRVSSGERVTVIPRGATAASSGTSVTVNFGDVAINNGMDLAELGMFVERSVVQALGA